MRKLISVLIIVSILLSLSASVLSADTVSFKDLILLEKKHWAYDTIMKLANAKIISGFPDGTYRPEDTVSREQFVKLIVEALQLEKTSRHSFDDIDKSWAKIYIETATKEGIIVPSEVGKNFRPTDPITRKDVAYMVARGLKIEPFKVWEPFDFPYKDTSDSTIAKLYTEYLLNGNIRDGYRYFDASRNMTRAEAAAVIARVMDYKADKDSYISTKRAALVNSIIKANKDTEFETFMKSDEAKNFTSVDYFSVENGLVTFKEFATWDFGDLVLENADYATMNKVVYNVIRDLVNYARKSNSYVRVLYSPVVNRIIISFYETTTQGERSSLPGNVIVAFYISPEKYDISKNKMSMMWQANSLWKSDDLSLNSIEDLAKINYTQNTYTDPLKAAMIDVYGATDGTSLFNYIVNEYRLDYTNSLKAKRTNYKVISLSGLEIMNVNDEGYGVCMATNIKK